MHKMNRPSPDEEQEILDNIGIVLAEQREEAITARKESGIEQVWMDCEEAYLGIDDLNRAEFANAKWAKPTSLQGPLTSNRSSQDSMRSSAYVRLTSRYVDAAAAKLGEILLPIDDKPFKFKHTEIPELVKQKEDLRALIDPVSGAQVMRGAKPDEVPGPSGQVPATVKDHAEKILEEAKKAADAAEKRIYDWLIECKFNAECRKVIHDSARIGVGILKAPFPDVQKSTALTNSSGVSSLQIVEKIVPVARWIDPWNLFPGGECGEDIHHSDGIFERDYISPRMLKKLADQGYLKNQIEKVLEEGPNKIATGGRNPAEKKNKKRFEIWYYYGSFKLSDLRVLKAKGIDDVQEDKTEVFAIITMVNDSVIRANINPLDSGKFPYHAMPWSRRAGHWAGVGVGEQVAMPQRMVNAATRAMLNNGGKSAGCQFIVDQGSIEPADGVWVITPDKIWKSSQDAASNLDVTKAFTAVQIPSMQAPLMNIIQYAFKLAEEASSIPLVTQGQEGETSPQTFGQAELQNTNAHTLLRSIAYSWDDHITEPVINGFYEWLLLDPSVPDVEKGDFKINAHGSIAMVEKAIQEQVIGQIGGMVINPAFGVDPKKWFAEYMKTKRLDPRNIQYTEEELAKIQSQPPAPPIQLQVEQMKQQGAIALQKSKAQAEMQMIQIEAQQEQQSLMNGQATPHMAQAQAAIAREKIKASAMLEAEYSRANAEQMRAQKELEIATQNGQLRIEELRLKKEIALLEYTNKQNLSLEQSKAQLAKTAMDNQTKKELAAAEIQLAQSENAEDRQHDLHKHHISLQRDMMTTSNTP